MSPAPEGTCTVSQNVPSGLTVSIDIAKQTDAFKVSMTTLLSVCYHTIITPISHFESKIYLKVRNLSYITINPFITTVVQFSLLFNHLLRHSIDQQRKTVAGPSRKASKKNNETTTVAATSFFSFQFQRSPYSNRHDSPNEHVTSPARCSVKNLLNFFINLPTSKCWRRKCSSRCEKHSKSPDNFSISLLIISYSHTKQLQNTHVINGVINHVARRCIITTTFKTCTTKVIVFIKRPYVLRRIRKLKIHIYHNKKWPNSPIDGYISTWNMFDLNHVYPVLINIFLVGAAKCLKVRQ